MLCFSIEQVAPEASGPRHQNTLCRGAKACLSNSLHRITRAVDTAHTIRINKWSALTTMKALVCLLIPTIAQVQQIFLPQSRSACRECCCVARLKKWNGQTRKDGQGRGYSITKQQQQFLPHTGTVPLTNCGPSIQISIDYPKQATAFAPIVGATPEGGIQAVTWLSTGWHVSDTSDSLGVHLCA